MDLPSRRTTFSRTATNMSQSQPACLVNFVLRTVLPDAVLRVGGAWRHVAVAAVRVAAGVGVVRVVLVVLVVVGISVEVREEASSAVVPVSEAVVPGAPTNEAAAPELAASRDARNEAAAATESTDLAAPMTFRHGSPCRIASRREREEPSEQEDGQATVSMPCWRHGHSIRNRRAIRPRGGGSAEGLVTSRPGSRCRTTAPIRQQPAEMSAGP